MRSVDTYRTAAYLLAAAGWVLLAVPGETRAQDSPHGNTAMALDCSGCHTEDAWRPARRPMQFDHAETGYALDGSHASATCRGCHIGWDFSEPRVGASDCGACHVDVHQGNLSSDCGSCHTMESFADVQGQEVHLRTSFPLTGMHLQVSCESCHIDDTGGAYTALDTDCFSCHQADYASTTTIDHVASGFSTDCSSCHNTIAFGGGIVYDHVAVSGGFRLLGAHDLIPCAACHVLPEFVPLFPGVSDQDCYGCHQPDYEREHPAVVFPTTCQDCHTVDTWEGAGFPGHDALFPIFSGPHNGRWSGCSDCHTVPSDYSSFSCLNCHEHSQPAMDDKHSEQPGYVYESNACLSCHPDGRHE
jgi:mono/diheme cytochrome c family protein